MRWSLLALLALAACDDSGKPPVGEEPTGATNDADGDGFTVAAGDCDDDDATFNPAAEELCDGLDQDCDGEPDDGVLGTWYADADGDGHGDPETGTLACEGSVDAGDDCNDLDPTIRPDAQEVCDGVDQDCDGEEDDGVTGTWYADADGDGHGDADAPIEACEAPAGASDLGDDCNDASAETFPGNEEVCDERDNDCDSLVDEGVTTTWYVDLDGDGYGDPSLTQEACYAPTGFAAEASDCDDTTAGTNPGAEETCNEVDDDCDTTVDEPDAADAATWYDDVDGDGYGDPDAATIACDPPAGAVAADGDCEDTDATLNPATVWSIDYDGDGYGSSAFTLTQCEEPAGYLREDGDCDDAVAAVNPGATETCNDRDDDCDTLVDDDDSPVSGTATWYADVDGDGYGDASATVSACDAPAGYAADASDCDDGTTSTHPGADEAWYDGVDADCDGADDPSVCDELPGASTVAWDSACVAAYAGSGWSVTTEWSTDSSTYYASGNSYDQVMMMPAVGSLNDDDGDGDVDDQDIPDVAYTTFAGSSYGGIGYLRVVSGDGSGDWLDVASVTQGASTYYVAGAGGVGLGDIDADGSPDIVVMSSGGDVLALENDGTLKWVYDTALSIYSYPTLADLDGDGLAEVAIGPTILDSTGALVSSCSEGSNAYPSIPADLDGDGTMELVVGHAVCTMAGTVVWDSGRSQGWPGVGNFDADDEPEVVNVDYVNGRVDLLDDDGTLLWSTSLTGGGGPPAIADVDGDGSPEIGVSGTTKFTVLEHTGATKWTYTIDDSSSRSTGASAFDFDGDGAAELVYADEHTLFVFDGASGAVLHSETGHVSGTLREYPVVADVDRDAHAEIVLASCDYAGTGWTGVRALGEENGEWASAKLRWNQHAYAPGLVTDDLAIVSDPEPEWLATNSQRTQTAWSAEPDGAADLSATLLGACDDCVNGELDVYVVLDNLGAVFVPDGASVALYSVSGSTRTLLEEQLTDAPIAPGDRTAPYRFTVALADVGSGGLVVVLDGDDTVRECDDTNNEASWSEAACTP